jgi:spore coat polysaccharide biosynthesis predicted glycosyltransferase SpsG
MIEDMKKKVEILVSLGGPDKDLVRKIVMELINQSWASVLDSRRAQFIAEWLVEYEENK